MKQILKKIGSMLLTLCLVMSMLSTAVFAEGTALYVANKISSYSGNLIVAVNGNTVTVTGTVPDAASDLTMTIPSNVTVLWKASITTSSSFTNTLFVLTGTGIFEVGLNGMIHSGSGTAIDSIEGTVVISGGTVKSDSGMAINTSGDTVKVSGGTVSTKIGTAINAHTNGDTTIIISNDGTVEATGNFGKAIVAHHLDLVQVKDNAVVSASNGYAIETSYNVEVSGGMVSSGLSSAIYTNGANSTVEVSGGTVTNSSASFACPVIYMSSSSFNQNSKVVISGTGKVLTYGAGTYDTAIRTYGDVEIKDSAQVKATTGYAIYTEGADSEVVVSGGLVSATDGYAIYSDGASATVGVNGGTIFAYGAAIKDAVINLPNNASGFTEPTGDSVVIAWNKDAGFTTYSYDATDENGDLNVLPNDATVKWTKQDNESGISSTNGVNTSFIQVAGVTVSKLGVLIDGQNYQVASDRAHFYTFDLTTLLQNTSIDPSLISLYTRIQYTNDHNIFVGPPVVIGSILTLPIGSVNIGGVTDTVTIGFTSDYYDISNAIITVEIVEKTSVTISADMVGGVYNGQEYAHSNVTVIANTDSSNITDSVTLEASYLGINDTTYGPTSNAPTNAGSYQLTLSVPDSDATYTGSTSYTFTIEKRPVTIGNNKPSGGGSITPAISAPSAPDVLGSTSTTKVTAKTDANGTATAYVTESQMTTAITAALEAAKSTGEAHRVEIQVSGTNGASSIETSLPKATVQALVTGEVGFLTLTSDIADLTFDAQAIAFIADVTTGDVSFTASKVENSTLSDTARQLVSDRPVYNFSITSDDKTITQFGGIVTIALPYIPTAGEDTNAIVSYYINTDGEPELMQNCYYDADTGSLVFTTDHFSHFAVGYNKVVFKDVSDTAWYTDAISYLAARDITSGTTKTTFTPNGTLTRGQFITLLMRAYSIDSGDYTADNFADAGNTYYTGYLAAAKRLEISNGVGDNMFAPEQAITRQEMFTMLYNTLKTIHQLPEGDSGKKISDLKDQLEISSYAQESITYLMETGIVSGNNGHLKPTETTTRAEMAQVLYNLLSK